jgi:hypothetical protein
MPGRRGAVGRARGGGPDTGRAAQASGLDPWQAAAPEAAARSARRRAGPNARRRAGPRVSGGGVGPQRAMHDGAGWIRGAVAARAPTNCTRSARRQCGAQRAASAAHGGGSSLRVATVVRGRGERRWGGVSRKQS